MKKYALLMLVACGSDLDEDGDGFTVLTGDCDEGDPYINPNGVEICDEKDNNCDGEIDEIGAKGGRIYYVDIDGDGFGNEAATLEACSLPEGYSESRLDCDEGNAEVNPDAEEICNGEDDNCDTVIDNSAIDAIDWHPDLDGDGYGNAQEIYRDCSAPPDHVEDGSDCDDVDPNINPMAAESCETPHDDDCDNDENDEGAFGCTDYYADLDGDGHAGGGLCLCEPTQSHFYTESSDCDDTDPDVNPDMVEIEDWKDQDCDGIDQFDLNYSDHAIVGMAGQYLGSEMDIADIDGDGDLDVLVGGIYSRLIRIDGPLTDKHNTDDAPMNLYNNANNGLGLNLAIVDDINGDGVLDFLASEHGNDSMGVPDEGVVYLFSGALTGDTVETMGEFRNGLSNYLGYAMTKGADFTNDGLLDVAVGSYTMQSVYIIQPGEDLYGSGTPIEIAEPMFIDSEYFGRSVAALSDINGDGIADLGIGDHRADIPNTLVPPHDTGQGAGALHVYHGPVSDFPEPDVSIYGSRRYLQFTKGGAIDAGDHNGDGHIDLLLGSSSSSLVQVYSGAAWLMLGPFDYPMTPLDFPTTDDADAIFTADEGDYMNLAVFAGDVDDDGMMDIALGANQSQNNTGRCYLALGSVSGHVELPKKSVVLSRHQDSAYSCYALTAPGDINDDGRDDLLISTPRYDSPDRNGSGVIDFIFGGER